MWAVAARAEVAAAARAVAAWAVAAWVEGARWMASVVSAERVRAAGGRDPAGRGLDHGEATVVGTERVAARAVAAWVEVAAAARAVATWAVAAWAEGARWMAAVVSAEGARAAAGRDHAEATVVGMERVAARARPFRRMQLRKLRDCAHLGIRHRPCRPPSRQNHPRQGWAL